MRQTDLLLYVYPSIVNSDIVLQGYKVSAESKISHNCVNCCEAPHCQYENSKLPKEKRMGKGVVSPSRGKGRRIKRGRKGSDDDEKREGKQG